jgi:putative DNA primase/helicase
MKHPTHDSSEDDTLDFPEIDERPRWKAYLDRCGPEHKKQPGIWYHGLTKPNRDGEQLPYDDWICGPLMVEATTRDADGQSFGAMLKFKNKLGHWRQWNMPSRLLAAGGGGGQDGLIGELLDLGLKIKFDKQNRIAAYISDQTPHKTMWAALQVGWYENAFVLPDQVIGGSGDVFFQSCHATQKEYRQAGTVAEWQAHIGRYCMANPVLLFTASIAFAGALLQPCAADGIGFHFFGDSSRGKSTVMKLATSVWGPWASYRRTWKATANGLEASASLFNDGLLALDEIGDGEAKEIAQILYALGNGVGKQRAKQSGGAKKIATWRVATLSNGEKTIEAHLAEKGILAKAGQLMRLLQVPIFGKYGCFDTLHGFADGSSFADALAANAAKHYGAVGVAYLEKLSADLHTGRDFQALLAQFIQKIESLCKTGLTPQEKRAAKAFALAGMAGELATEYALTGWQEGQAMKAALQCYTAWRAHRGEGDSEGIQILKAVQGYLEVYGDARFTHVNDETRLHGERSGYWRNDENGAKEWLLTASGLARAAPTYELKQITAALLSAGWLKPGKSRLQQQQRTGAEQTKGFFYVISLDDPPEIEP